MSARAAPPPEARHYVHMAAPLAAELCARWPLDDRALVEWLAGVVALGATVERADAVPHPRITTFADLLQAARAHRERQRLGLEAE